MRLCDVVIDTVLGFNPSSYMTVRGRGMRRRKERSMSLVNGKSVVVVAIRRVKERKQ